MLNPEQIAKRLTACAAYLEETRLPIGEKETIERLLGCSAALKEIAKEMATDDAGNQPR